jgi:hypothetical protein
VLSGDGSDDQPERGEVCKLHHDDRAARLTKPSNGRRCSITLAHLACCLTDNMIPLF